MVAFKVARHAGDRLVLLVLIGWVACSCATTTNSGGIEPPTSPPSPAATASGGAVTCERPDPIFGPVYVAAEVYAGRTGVTAATFSGLGSRTKQHPLEECGIPAVLRRLVTLKCDDGSNPYGGSLAAAERTRAGSFGPGGRCDSIIDRYDIPCPERTYQVFTDCYVCVRPLKQTQMSIVDRDRAIIR